MKENVLSFEREYASKPLRGHLKGMDQIYVESRKQNELFISFFYLDGAQKADQIFLPVLESASKVQKLQTTLGLFNRSKFFFNLPSFIMESIEGVSSVCLVLSFQLVTNLFNHIGTV